MPRAPSIDAVLRTLADPTRRAVFETVSRRGECTVGTLVARFTVSQPAISQHLKMLRTAGLVIERRAGRNVHYRVEPRGLAPLLGWLEHYGAFWRDRFDNLEKTLKEMDR